MGVVTTITVALVAGAPDGATAADVQGKVVRVDPVAKVIVLDDGRAFALTERTVILVNGRPASATGLAPGTLVLVRDAEPAAAGAMTGAASTSGDLTTTVQAPQATVAVQIPQSKIVVQQAPPRIVVNQTPPQVVVAPAPAPQVSMSGTSGTEGSALPRQAQATSQAMATQGTVSTSGDLTTTVQAPQPTVAVEIPQSKVIVQQQPPRIVVNQTPPEVVVAPAPAPQVTLQQNAAATPSASPALAPATPSRSAAAPRPAARVTTAPVRSTDPAGTRDPWCAGDWDPGRGTNFGICSPRP